jgi:hypothetical protein
MATRCSIIVDGIDTVKVYKHWDGAPESTLEWLQVFNKDFTDNRGNDAEYKIAQLLRSSERDAKVFGLDPSKHTGWGIIPIDDDAGEEFIYFLHADGSVTVNNN